MVNGIIWWKLLLVIGITFPYSFISGSSYEGVEDHDVLRHVNENSTEEMYVNEMLQRWKKSSAILHRLHDIPVSSYTDSFDELLSLLSTMVEANAQVLLFLSKHNAYLQKVILIHEFMGIGIRPNNLVHVQHESHQQRKVLQKEEFDSSDDPDPDIPFNPFHPKTPPPKGNLPLPYQLTGDIPRKDPLRSFKTYKGGFNVTNVHYWSSASYTGFWGYTFACLSLLTSILYSILYWWGCIRNRNGNEEFLRKDKAAVKIFPTFLIISCSIIAITAAIVMYCGNAKLDRELRTTAGTLIGAANGVQFEINHALQMVQVATMFPISHQGSSHQFLQACFTLGRVFNRLQRKVKHNKEKVYKIFDAVKLALTIVSTALSFVVLLGVAGTFGKWRLILIGTFGLMTLLLFSSWLLAGVSFALTNVANDACMVMEDYAYNPANSSLSRFLPCLSTSLASKVLSGAKVAIKSLVTQANMVIDWANNEEKKIADKKNSTVDFELPRVCDPYGPAPLYGDHVCSTNETLFSNFGKIYGPFRCMNDNLTLCFEEGTPVPNFIFVQASMAMNASSIVYKMLPSIFSIVTCNFVKVTFDNILSNHCSPLRRSLTQLWASFMIASLAMMALQICWILLIKDNRFGIDPKMFTVKSMNLRSSRNQRAQSGSSMQMNSISTKGPEDIKTPKDKLKDVDHPLDIKEVTDSTSKRASKEIGPILPGMIG